MLIKEITKVLDLPPVRQKNESTCGPAVVRCCLGYYGIENDEDEITDETHTNDEVGTETDEMAASLRKHGLQTAEKIGMSLKDLRTCTQAGFPVIVMIQAWSDIKDYSKEWEEGHYVVVKSVGDGMVRMEDPATDHETELPEKEFMDRWRGYGRDGKKLPRWGLLVGPGKHRVDPIHRQVEEPD